MNPEQRNIQRASSDRSQSSSSSTSSLDIARTGGTTGIDGRPTGATPNQQTAIRAAQTVLREVASRTIPQNSPADQAAERRRILDPERQAERFESIIQNHRSEHPNTQVSRETMQDFGDHPRIRSRKGKFSKILRGQGDGKEDFIARNIKAIDTFQEELDRSTNVLESRAMSSIAKKLEDIEGSCERHGPYFRELPTDDFVAKRRELREMNASYDSYRKQYESRWPPAEVLKLSRRGGPQWEEYQRDRGALSSWAESYINAVSAYIEALRVRLASLRTAQQPSPEATAARHTSPEATAAQPGATTAEESHQGLP